MPIFEYKCEKCGRKFEKLVMGSESIRCPDCGSDKLQKLFSVFGVKSGEKFTPSSGSSCSSCTASTCDTCGSV